MEIRDFQKQREMSNSILKCIAMYCPLKFLFIGSAMILFRFSLLGKIKRKRDSFRTIECNYYVYYFVAFYAVGDFYPHPEIQTHTFLKLEFCSHKY